MIANHLARPKGTVHQLPVPSDETCRQCSRPIRVIDGTGAFTGQKLPIACPCIEEHEAERRQLDARMAADRALRAIAEENPILDDYENASLIHCVEDMENREALTIARNFVDLMRATPTGKRVPAFGMTGPKGVGKSYIAWATVRELRDLRIPAMGYTISQMVRAIMRVRKDEHKWDELFERLITVPVLFIDDLGKEYIRKDADNFVESFMFDVIDERTNRCLPTLVTSNFDPVALEQRRYAEHEKMQSIIDRLNKGFAKGSRWLEMGGQSRRVF